MSTAHPPHGNTLAPKLYMALELGKQKWDLGFTVGLGQKPRRRRIDARNLAQVEQEIALAKRRFKLDAATPVISCYEAGPDGFWLDRALQATLDVENHVVDSSSIEVNRRQRRAKTDRLDLEKLLRMLVRYDSGEQRVWSVVRPPSPSDEDARQLHRELLQLKTERTAGLNRLGGLLLGQGLVLPVDWQFPDRLDQARLWDGSAVAADLSARLLREFARLELIEEHLRQLEQERVRRLRQEPASEAIEMARRLLELRGIGLNGAWLLTMELFAWREIRNRRQLAALAGLAGTPYDSGQSERDQGISKAGNHRVRAVLVELAWLWLRYQPDSALAAWYERRFAGGNRRARKVGIVALARKLLVALRKWLNDGEVPLGAELVDWAPKLRVSYRYPSLLAPRRGGRTRQAA